MTSVIGLALLSLGVLVFALLLLLALRCSDRQDRRDWPERLRRDYEVERIRDHFFTLLSADDVEWMASQGWRPPADVAARRARELEMLALSRMISADRASWGRLRAAGVHLTAHPEDLKFP